MPSWVVVDNFSSLRAELGRLATLAIPEFGGTAVVVNERVLEPRHEVFYDTADLRILRGAIVVVERVVGVTHEISIESTSGVRFASAHAPSSVDHRAAQDRASPESWWHADADFATTLRTLLGPRALERWIATEERGVELTLRRGTRIEASLRLNSIETRAAPNAPLVALRTVEISDGEGELARRALELPAQLGLQPVSVSLFELALAAHGLAAAPAIDMGASTIDAKCSVGALAFASLRSNWRRCLRHEAGTRLGIDAEELHDQRVAVRRVRAALKLFGEVLPRRARQLCRELGWLGRVLGEVRDFDVQIAELKNWETTLVAAEREALAAVQTDLDRRRRRARRRLLRVLDSGRYERLLVRVERFCAAGPPRRNSAALRAARIVAPTLLAKCERRVRKRGRRLDSSAPATEWHELRKQARTFRYALEFFAPLFGNSLTQLVTALVALQDLLGAHQDAEVAESRLRVWIAQPRRRLPAATAFVIGRLCERYSRAAARERAKFESTFARVIGKRWKKLQKAMAARVLASGRAAAPAKSTTRSAHVSARGQSRRPN
ncbi:MAG: CHAD domain-containing protein [Planctomycetota bacterium]